MIIFCIVIAVIFFLCLLVGQVDTSGTLNQNNYQNVKSNSFSILDKISIEFLNNMADKIRIEKQIGQTEAIFIAACKIIDQIDTEKTLDKNTNSNPLESPYSIARVILLGIISNNYPNLQQRFMSYIQNKYEDKMQRNSKLNDKIIIDKLCEKAGVGNSKLFDFCELIDYNAEIIHKSENKNIKEATYLAICIIYDDLTEKQSKNGIQELMHIVHKNYNDLFNDVMTYAAWKYYPAMKFKPEFDEYMRKRHS